MRAQSSVSLRSAMPAVGDVIADKYRIEAVLGRGGMSVVYRATHLQLDQQVAIKVLSADALLLPEYVVRLKREARAVSRIRSEHVVRVHDIGELPDGGVPYLVMECLSGLDLAAVLIRRGPFPLDLAVECILQACEALAEAHALGIVHRDLKPANLFLTEAVDGSPCVKVVDFGISRMSRRHGLSSLTDPGTVLGTPSYMAPEQMEAAETVDGRADIWALGTILFELLIGKPPYTGESLPQIFMKIMRSKPPKPSAFRKDVPAAIDAIVARCLQIDAPDRYQTVAELGWALSTVGTPHARDSAARISRVFEKHISETSTPTLRSTVPPAMVKAIAPGSHGQRRFQRAWSVAAGIAGAALISAAGVFAVLSVKGSVPVGATTTSTSLTPAASSPAAPDDVEGDDAAVAIGPVIRPVPVEPVARVEITAAAAPATGARAARVAAAPAAMVPVPKHSAMVAVSMNAGEPQGGEAVAPLETTSPAGSAPPARAADADPPPAAEDGPRGTTDPD